MAADATYTTGAELFVDGGLIDLKVVGSDAGKVLA
jgi:hypothetical protein